MSNNIISSLGAGSGIDIASLVKQLTEVERAPLQKRIDTRQEKLDAQISGYGKLKSGLEDLSKVIGTLGSPDLFNARTVGVPSSEVISANSVKAGAQTGSYKIEVMQVASAQSLAMGQATDRAAALDKSGTMTIQFGDWSYTAAPDQAPDSFSVNDARAALSIQIEATDSLDSIAAKINAEKGGVQASVLKVDGTFQLMLTSESGASNAMRIAVDDPSLETFAFNEGNFANVTETQQASDARLKVNGLEVTRETNAITDVIDGFEFTLNKAAPGESLTYTISADKGTAEQAIRDFVEAYNSFQTTAKNLTGYSRDEKNTLVRGELAGDSAARAMVNRLREMLGAAVPGVSSGYSALTNIGIRTELDGSLSIKDEEFSKAISDNFDLVGRLFANTTSTTNTAVSMNLGTYAGNATAGTYTATITQDPSRGSIATDPFAHDFTNPLDASAGDYRFKIRVDGVESAEIALAGNDYTPESLRAELQTLINGDANLKAGRVGVDVRYDDVTKAFSFVSREYGSVSKVSFTEASGDMANIGISTGLTGTSGTDVAGTIDGMAGFGSGNLLLPALDSKLYGLNLSVNPGARDQGEFEITFSRGLAGELTKLISDFTSPSGTVKMRLDNIQKEINGLGEERTKLDTRMERFNARLYSQFIAMENIVNSLNSSGSQLDGLADRLPFTAPK